MMARYIAVRGATANTGLPAGEQAANPAEVVTPGEAQLAALIGVDPAQYTLAELVAMQPTND
jgi:hypothetical protein